MQSSQGARVRVPPPALYLVPLVAMLVLDRYVRLPLPGGRVTRVVGALVLLAGLGLLTAAMIGILRRRSTLIPHHAVAQLVTDGVYRISRNPIYTGGAVAYVGGSLVASTWWPLFVLPVIVLVVQRLVIVPEEEYLRSRFGQQYEDYCRQVRRWL